MDSDLPDSDQSLKRYLRPRMVRQDTDNKKMKLSDANFSMNESQEDIENVYRQDSSKMSSFRPTSLETIYESPKGKNLNQKNFMGVVKLRRQCKFPSLDNPSKVKAKLRKTKSKRLKRTGVKVPSGFKVTIDQVKEALQNVSEDENENEKMFKSPIYNLKTFLHRTTKPVTDHHDKNTVTSDSSNSLEMRVDNDLNLDINDLPNQHIQTTKQQAYQSVLDMKDFDNCNLFSFKHKIDKSIKQRRRSGLIKPLCNENNDPLHLDVKSIKPFFSQSSQNVAGAGMSDPGLLVSICNSSSPITETEGKSDEMIGNNKNSFQGTMTVAENRDSLSSDSTKFSLNLKESFCSPTLVFPKQSSPPNKENTKVKYKTRRISGISRPLYKEMDNALSPELDLMDNELTNSSLSEHNPDMEMINASLNHDIPVQIDVTPSFPLEPSTTNKLSPSLMENLNIHSPESVFYNKARKSRRKSARLSFGGSEPSFGSLWIQKSSPNDSLNRPTKEEQLPTSKSEFPPKVVQPSNKTLPIASDSPWLNINNAKDVLMTQATCLQSSCGNSLLKQSSNTQLVIQDANVLNNSPILSGIIDCKARLNKDKKFIVKKGSRLNLNHFSRR